MAHTIVHGYDDYESQSYHQPSWLAVGDYKQDTLLSAGDSASHEAFTTSTAFDSVYESVDSHRPSPCPVFDLSSESIRLSPSPQETQQPSTGAAWQPFASHVGSSPHTSPFSAADSHTFSDLPSASTWTSPDLGLSYSSHPSPESIDPFDVVAQSIEVPSSNFISAPLDDIHTYTTADPNLLGFHDYNHTYNPPAFVAGSAVSTPFNLSGLAEHVDSYFSVESTPPPFSWTIQRHGSVTSDYDHASGFSTPARERGRSVSTSRKHSQSVSTLVNPSRVIKRTASTTSARRLSGPLAFHHRTNSKSCSPARFSRSGSITASPSNFPCPLAPYGCTSSFGSKNEWKRHMSTQHLRLDLWRCDQCPDRDVRPNDFNRKDLFIQHLRRMHHRASSTDPSLSRSNSSSTTSGRPRARSVLSPEFHQQHQHHGCSSQDLAIATAEQRCHIRLRLPPAHSCCLFCDAEFDGPGSWEERMEHVGRHLEADKKEGRDAPHPSTWRRDADFEAWCEVEGLIARSDSDEGEGWVVADVRRKASTPAC